jgi:hypothetical protein
MYDNKEKKMLPARFPSHPDFRQQKFQNLVFRNGYMYLQPSGGGCKAIYRINMKQLSCDSVHLPNEITLDSSGTYKEGPRKMDVLQIDKKGRFAYFCYNMSLFQLDLVTLKARRIITVTDKEKPFQGFYNMFWYRLDDMDNLWVMIENSDIKVYEPGNFQIVKRIPIEKDSYGLQFFNVDGESIMCYLNSNGLLLVDYKNKSQFNLKLSDGLITTFNSSVAAVNRMLFIGAVDYFHYLPLAAVLKTGLKRSCYLTNIQLYNKRFKTDSIAEFLHTLSLDHNQNFITLTFSSTEFDQPERLEYRYKMDGIDKDWVYVNYLERTISYNNLQAGSYTFHAAVKNPDGEWSKDEVNLAITIIPAWWQTNWFKITAIGIACCLAIWLVRMRIRDVRREEQQRSRYEREILELEAKALRAQMNPHFVFNSLNSIKSLINKNENDKAAEYLTTFSKLIRTLFQNSDKREVSLFEELETCKLYTQLEKMRFSTKVDFVFDIDESLDLKDIKIPALMLQPFIENAIWHGLVPKDKGGKVIVTVRGRDGAVECIIDDDGVGRELSRQYKAQYRATHESKGIGLTHSRLELDKLLNQREYTIRIIDKTDKAGLSMGTTAILTFKENK